jgi:hypothetical protein
MDEPLTRVAGVLAGGAVLCTIAVLIYGFFGHDFVKAVYDGKVLDVDKWLMRSKAITPLENYYDAADGLVLQWLLLPTILVPFAIICLGKPLGVLLASCSMLLFSFFLFSAVEFFPSLVKVLHLDILPFYSFRESWVADDILAYRGKPFAHNRTDNFRGDLYSPLYEIDVPAISAEEALDENGFKNSVAVEFPDIVVLGDSYMEDGMDEGDTFPRRLNKNLPGITVVNLAKAGYGPNQYVEVLKRYGISKKPRYVLLAFFEGNDIDNIVSYLRWREGKPGGESYGVIYDALSAKSLVTGYTIAVKQALAYGRQRIWGQIWPAWQALFEQAGSIHPDVAVLRLGDKNYKVILPIGESSLRSMEEMLQSEEYGILRRLLVEFRDLCVKNNIVPIILYVPDAVHIYADYSTQESGSRWLNARSQQIATKDETEKSVRYLAKYHQINFISLTPAFEKAAKEGELLYYPLDTHWNSEGKELAARYVAAELRSRFLSHQSK